MEAEEILYGRRGPRMQTVSELERLRRWGLHAFPEPLLSQAMELLQPEYQMILEMGEKGLGNKEIAEELGFYGRERRRIGNLRSQAEARLIAELDQLQGSTDD